MSNETILEDRITEVRAEKKKEVKGKVAGQEVENIEWSKQEELDFTYTIFDKIFRLSLGEMPVYSGGYYHGDFSISLDQAQRQKCEYISEQLGLKEGKRILDIGCGWGGWLNYVRNVTKASGVGVNLSSGQVASCRKNGLEVYLKDGRYIKQEDFGQFDAITAMGSPEHFCSIDTYLAGQQDEVYKDFFKHAYDLLPDGPGSRIYLQSMVFGRNMLPFDEFDITAHKESPQYILALLRKQFPDSWLPYGGQHLIRCAEPYFKCTHHSSGRVDYVKTNEEWTKRYKRFHPYKYWLYLGMLPKFIMDKEFRWNLNILLEGANRKAFEREIFDHSKLVFEKV